MGNTTQQDFDARLKKVVVSLCTSLHFQQCSLYTHESELAFRVRITSGFTDEQENSLQQCRLAVEDIHTLMAVAERANDVYIIPHTSPLWREPFIFECLHVTEGPIDILLLPLIDAQQTLISLLVLGHSSKKNILTHEALLFLTVFAEQATLLLEEERLYKEARQSNEERTAIVEIGRALFAPSALHDVKEVYYTIYEQTRAIMPVDALLISRYNHQDGTMTMEYLIDEGVVYPAFPYEEIPFWIKNLLFVKKQTYAFGTAEEYNDFAIANHQASFLEDDNDLFGSNRPSQSLLFVPIFYGDELIGVLSAQSYQRHAYTPRHLALLEEIGVQAGIALTNALSYVKLVQALKEAQKSEQLTNHFLMTASHELRTPLTSIQGYLELLATHENTLDTETRRRFVGMASLACEELVLLLANIMDTSHIDKDRVTLRSEVVHVTHAVQRMADMLEPTFTLEKRVLELDVTEYLYVLADDSRLRQILLNVVGNALKYAPGSKIAITVTSEERTALEQRLVSLQLPALIKDFSHFVVFSVRDWGPGIAQEELGLLFTKFMRLERAMNSVQRGAGLGLYLCRQLAEAMHGQIWVESTGIADEGTAFLLALPQVVQ